MKAMFLVTAMLLSLFSGCSNECKEIPYWDGSSAQIFEERTMESMLWLWLPPYEDDAGYCIEKSTVFKRYDDADFEILLSCLKNPEVKYALPEQRLGRYLYVSFLDGSRYIVDFKFSHENESVITLNGQSKILYRLLGDKEPVSTFKPSDPRMDKYGRITDPNIIMQ
jgi:hypothetical protein